MQLTITSLLALAATTMAIPSQPTNNYCPHPKYMQQVLNATGGHPTDVIELPSREAFVYPITGQGNQVDAANETFYFGDNSVGRLLLGTSWVDDIVYWLIFLLHRPFEGCC